MTDDGDEFRWFNADELLGYLSELDDILADLHLDEAVHLTIAGGAAMLTKLNTRLTQDVDVVSEGMPGEIRIAVERVSERHPGLRRDWLNDGAKLKRVSLPATPERIYTGRNLVVDSVGARYILAMKLAAGRAIDEQDCVHLIRELGIEDENELMDLIEQAIPAHLRTPDMAYFAQARLAEAQRGG